MLASGVEQSESLTQASTLFRSFSHTGHHRALSRASRAVHSRPLFSILLIHVAACVCGLARWLRSKESACQCRRHSSCGFRPWVRKIPWRRKWQTTPVFLAVKSHGQRGLVGYSPWGKKRARYDLVTKWKQLIQTLETWARSNYLESLFYSS